MSTTKPINIMKLHCLQNIYDIPIIFILFLLFFSFIFHVQQTVTMINNNSKNTYKVKQKIKTNKQTIFSKDDLKINVTILTGIITANDYKKKRKKKK